MTADIDAVLSRLRTEIAQRMSARVDSRREQILTDRPLPLLNDAVEVIERLTAERDRLREALGDVAALADRGVAWSSFTRQKVLDVCAAALGESPVPDEPTAAPKQVIAALIRAGIDNDTVSRVMCAFDKHAAPSHPTGEERTDG